MTQCYCHVNVLFSLSFVCSAFLRLCLRLCLSTASSSSSSTRSMLHYKLHELIIKPTLFA